MIKRSQSKSFRIELLKDIQRFLSGCPNNKESEVLRIVLSTFLVLMWGIDGPTGTTFRELFGRTLRTTDCSKSFFFFFARQKLLSTDSDIFSPFSESLYIVLWASLLANVPCSIGFFSFKEAYSLCQVVVTLFIQGGPFRYEDSIQRGPIMFLRGIVTGKMVK